MDTQGRRGEKKQHPSTEVCTGTQVKELGCAEASGKFDRRGNVGARDSDLEAWVGLKHDCFSAISPEILRHSQGRISWQKYICTSVLERFPV